MFSSLRLRILLAALTAITLALIINGIASYLTVKQHNAQQITRNLDAVVRGNSSALSEWIASRSTMLSGMDEAIASDDPRAALRQLTTSGNFMAGSHRLISILGSVLGTKQRWRHVTPS